MFSGVAKSLKRVVHDSFFDQLHNFIHLELVHNLRVLLMYSTGYITIKQLIVKCACYFDRFLQNI